MNKNAVHVPSFLKLADRNPNVVVEREPALRRLTWAKGDRAVSLRGYWTASELREIAAMMGTRRN